MNKRVLVTGGAGYVGAHACLRLHEAGYEPVVMDNLSNGHASFVQWGPLEQGDIRDGARLAEVFRRYQPAAVMHFAARIEVGESMTNPSIYYDVNVGGSASVIEAALDAGVKNLVFSSTCATYGNNSDESIDEGHPQHPQNPYGRSKLMVEQILSDVGDRQGLSFTVLRYFNAAGADPQGRIGERHDPETHAVPLLIQTALGQRPTFSIYGHDYETRDGTAVRDYVHVLDLADAHVAAMERLLAGGKSDSFNLGTGRGTSVFELIEAVKKTSGRDFPLEWAPRRPGDAAALVANGAKAREVLGWCPRLSLDDIVADAWRWHEQLQDGKYSR